MNTLPQNPSNPASDLALLEEKRRALRREALAYLAEAWSAPIEWSILNVNSQSDFSPLL